MDGDYNFPADALSKFHTAPVIIQALLVIASATVVLGIAWCLTVPFRLWLTHRFAPHQPQGDLVYGVVRAPDGRWLVYVDGNVSEIDAASMEQFEARRKGKGGVLPEGRS